MEEKERFINLGKIILYDNVREDKLIRQTVDLYAIILEKFEKNSNNEQVEEYFAIQRELLDNLELDKRMENAEGKISVWQDYVCRLILKSENKFSLAAEKNCRIQGLTAIAAREAEVLKELYCLDWNLFSNYFNDENCVASFPVAIECVESKNMGINNYFALHEIFTSENTALENKKTAEQLFDFYNARGAGIFSMANAFTWEGGKLCGIENYNPLTFDELVGCEMQKERLIENTKFLLKGLTGNNALLFGDRGTGKSSSVKALLPMFQNQKLKIIAARKNQILELDKIFSLIEERGCKFILFIDDLSFEEDEIEYKGFKSIIEGGLGKQPENTLIYVTTNRRHLIRETWKDRSSELGDIHQNDGIQERTSLSDRFGLTLTYSAPGKEEYLTIIRTLAIKEGLVSGEEKEQKNALEKIEAEALQWEVRHNGRSGRAARQFINFMKNKQDIWANQA